MKSFLLANNNASTLVAGGGTIPIGSAVHGFGGDIKLNGNNIILRTTGYYDADIAVSAVVTGTDTVTMSLYLDGTAVAGASASNTPVAAGDVTEFVIPWVFRKSCGCDVSNLSIVTDGSVTVQNVVVRVAKM